MRARRTRSSRRTARPGCSAGRGRQRRPKPWPRLCRSMYSRSSASAPRWSGSPMRTSSSWAAAATCARMRGSAARSATPAGSVWTRNRPGVSGTVATASSMAAGLTLAMGYSGRSATRCVAGPSPLRPTSTGIGPGRAGGTTTSWSSTARSSASSARGRSATPSGRRTPPEAAPSPAGTPAASAAAVPRGRTCAWRATTPTSARRPWKRSTRGLPCGRATACTSWPATPRPRWCASSWAAIPVRRSGK
mmetsp:Transcript_20818/g.65402  ORF Transcript_20818/g.65402 Transcript_20818/m.65402 type:complete len:248 (+) Transcript_20818:466-1209(+)